MDEYILEFIRSLTAADKKSLSQKALKLTEEVGELAKVILPFENAHATTHRFIDRRNILEELADCHLVLMSILYDMGFSDSEFHQMVEKKSKVWADLQAREGKVKYPIPYEIHITVSVDSRSDEENASFLEGFKAACQEAKVKPILLDLYSRKGAKIKDLMTSSVFLGNNKEAFIEMKRISGALALSGFTVVREKIETVPWHPAAPSKDHLHPKMPPGCYFECHFGVDCSSDRVEKLGELALALDVHKSQNAFKWYSADNFTVMLTARDYDTTYEKFTERTKYVTSCLMEEGFTLDDTITEFSVYDSKVTHDIEWLLKE